MAYDCTVFPHKFNNFSGRRRFLHIFQLLLNTPRLARSSLLENIMAYFSLDLLQIEAVTIVTKQSSQPVKP